MNNEMFSNKFKGIVYDDAWRDSAGHIWFGGNKYEYVPFNSIFNRPEHVIIHNFVQTEFGFSLNPKTSYAKIKILD